MRVLSLFSGGGLGDFGLMRAGMEIAGQVEIDKFCQEILKLRWPEVPKWEDVRSVTGKEVEQRCGRIDIVAGGFPCQPFSVAGKRSGEKDERFLWGEMHRIICEVKPRWVLAENVPGLLSIDDGRVMGIVVRDLAASGYRVEWDCISASAVGAPHQRDRVWIVGYAEHYGRNGTKDGQSNSQGNECDTKREKQVCEPKRSGSTRKGNVADSDNVHAQGRIGRSNDKKKRKVTKKRQAGFCGEIRNATSAGFPVGSVFALGKSRQVKEPERSNWWAVEPRVGRVAHGIAKRVDRLKLLGNGQVVQVVEWIGKRIMEIENE